MGCSYLTKNKIFRRPECETQKQYEFPYCALIIGLLWMQHGIKYVIFAETRIRTWVIAATTQCTNHYTISAHAKSSVIPHPCRLMGCSYLTKNKIFRRPECEPQKQYNISLLRSHYRASMDAARYKVCNICRDQDSNLGYCGHNAMY